MKHYRIAFAALLLVVLILPTLVGAQDEIGSASILLEEEGITVPESIAAGWTEISFENSAEIPSFLFMGRLDEGVTLDEFMAALMGVMMGETTDMPPATFTGSPATMPGSVSTAVYNLEPGTHIVLNLATEEPQIATFMVEGEASESDLEMEYDQLVTLVDFAFGLPTELESGEHVWMINNAGEQPHEMVFIPVPDGTTMEDAMAMLMAGEGEGEAGSEEAGGPEFAFLWAPMDSGQEAWVTVDLMPGTYLVTCFIPDSESEDGAIHAQQGMVQIVTVVEAAN